MVDIVYFGVIGAVLLWLLVDWLKRRRISEPTPSPVIDRPIYVIALTLQHALHWADNVGLKSRDWRYVKDAKSLRGLDRNTTVVMYETGWERKDIEEILDVTWSRGIRLHDASA